ncbi:MAG: hypothetical protein HYY52_01035 [Candidatus Melainabacteria bacterium]|nr:hypothetical protein [Candidatus Melainabacteria bacterium]
MKINYLQFIVLFLIIAFIQAPSFSTELNHLPESDSNNSSPLLAFKNPVCLLVGLSNNELSYREISSLSGFDFFSVPYRADIVALVQEIKPSQVIIKHPSGFVGLYSTEGQLIRGVETQGGSEISTYPNSEVPSIIQPPNSYNGYFQNVYYPGLETGSVPHGGVGYVQPPKGRNLPRHLLKLATLASFTVFQYPGYFNAFSGQNNKGSLFSSLLLPNIPIGISAAATYADSRFDETQYEQARTQPRDYMFQPVIEGY